MKDQENGKEIHFIEEERRNMMISFVLKTLFSIIIIKNSVLENIDHQEDSLILVGFTPLFINGVLVNIKKATNMLLG